MKKRILCVRYSLIPLGMLILVAMSSNALVADDSPEKKEVDVVWTKSDGIRPEIFYTTTSDGNWSEPMMVTDDYFDNMHPVIDRDTAGTRWIFWTAYDNGRTEIRYTTGDGNEWEPPRSLAFEMKSNTGPSVVIDKDDAVWVVWSASEEDLDDIYYSVNRDGVWSEAQILHETNDTPDTLPVIELNDAGTPSVSWKQLRDDGYVALTASYDDSTWSQPVVVEEDEGNGDGSENETVTLPDFIQQGGMVFIREYQ